MELAHIIIFAFNRPDHFKLTIKSLLQNKLASDSCVTIFCDGPRNQSDITNVMLVREFAKSIKGFKSIDIIEQSTNKGLSKSIIDGVTDTLSKHDSVIVLEDDLVSSPNFLNYMNQSLRMYENSMNVVSIHGYCYPVLHELPETFFIKGADCWGWATWKRGWMIFEEDGATLLKKLEELSLCKEFDFDNSFPYTKMLKNQISGKIQSWAIRWYASAFLNNMLTLYPGKSLIKNIGNDFSGTNSWEGNRYNVNLEKTTFNFKFIETVENKDAKKIISNFFRLTKKNFVLKIISKSIFKIKKFKKYL
jgi:hypothetical protein